MKAIQWDGNGAKITGFLLNEYSRVNWYHLDDGAITIPVIQGHLRLEIGDWIVKEWHEGLERYLRFTDKEFREIFMTTDEIKFEVAVNAGRCLAWNCKSEATATGFCEYHSPRIMKRVIFDPPPTLREGQVLQVHGDQYEIIERGKTVAHGRCVVPPEPKVRLERLITQLRDRPQFHHARVDEVVMLSEILAEVMPNE